MAEHGQAELQLHLDPSSPIEVRELTDALESLARQYRVFANRQGWLKGGVEARLLVSSVSPGSIDINMVPDLLAAAAPMIGQIAGNAKTLADGAASAAAFANHIKNLLNIFKKPAVEAAKEVKIKDCQDVINIVNPVAQNGGVQTFNTYNYTINGPIIVPVASVNSQEAGELIQRSFRTMALLNQASEKKYQRVAMIWKQLDRDAAKSDGRTPDKALISDIDPQPKPAFFSDEQQHFKRELINEDENPYQMMYFVDVEVSKIEGRIVSYRIVGYHGKQKFEV